MECSTYGTDGLVSEQEAIDFLDSLIASLQKTRRLERVLIIPPDITRFHSWAGFITEHLYRVLSPNASITILPALGTHAPMSDDELGHMFPSIPKEHIVPHLWRTEVRNIGTIPAEFIEEISQGKVAFEAQVAINRRLIDQSWDAIFSVGQLVPHEVIGIANHNKNIFVGVGGSDLINKSHWLGAVHGIEKIMGHAHSPVRSMLNYASTHFIKNLPIIYVLTVRKRAVHGEMVTCGLFAGDDHACFERGAELCRQENLTYLDRAPKKIVVYLDPSEFKSTWLGNKAVYRTRMAVADDGEVIVLAPGVRMFGEDDAIDSLIRKYGYRGTPMTMQAVQQNEDLAGNLSAAAHLIHGSSEGRFRITYCPGHLSRDEIEAVGYQYADYQTWYAHYNPKSLQDGWNTLPDGEEIYYISNPALGLWGTTERFSRA